MVSNEHTQPFVIGITRSIYSRTTGEIPDHVVVDEAVIYLGDERYWLDATVDPESDESPHTKL